MPDKRKKISSACDNCRKSKLKCTGGTTCSLCSKKGIKCEYTRVDRRSFRASKHRITKHYPIKPAFKQTNNRITIDPKYQQSKSHTSVTCSDDEKNMGEKIYNVVHPLNESGSESLDNGALRTSESYPEIDMLRPYNYMCNTGQTIDSKNLDKKNINANDTQGPRFSYNDGKCSFLLPDSIGKLRYIGETSMYSLLYETRILFIRSIGPTGFTDILKRCPVEDSPFSTKDCPVGLPSREVVNIYLKNFIDNVNDTFFIIDIDEFKSKVIESVFRGVYVDKANMALMYLIFAVGSTFVKDPNKIKDTNTDIMYFNKGNNVLKENIVNDGIWLSQAYLLNHFFYQYSCKFLTSWVELGLAIRYAQAFGIHRTFINDRFSNEKESYDNKRLFRSLYVCDTISSVFLGRPLAINNYDCEDYQNISSTLETFNDKCQHEILKLCQIIGRIITNFYNNFLDFEKAKNLAIELKLWSTKLPDDLKIDKIVEWNNIPSINLSPGAKYNLLVLHILQLFGIMLLSRPFFVYEITSHLSKEKSSPSGKNMVQQLYSASVKAAILSIKLIYYYMKSGTCRLDLYIIVNCCGYAAFILGLRLLDRGAGCLNEREIRGALDIAVLILKLYSPHSPLADRLFEIVNRMIEALVETKRNDTAIFTSPLNIPDGQLFPQDFTSAHFTDIDFLGDQNNNLETLKEFQQYFIPDSFATTVVMPDYLRDGSFNPPYANDTYFLFIGEKC